MKASLDEKGALVISAESPLESFALSHWYNLWDKGETTLQVTTVERACDGSDHLPTSLKNVMAAPNIKPQL